MDLVLGPSLRATTCRTVRCHCVLAIGTHGSSARFRSRCISDPDLAAAYLLAELARLSLPPKWQNRFVGKAAVPRGSVPLLGPFV